MGKIPQNLREIIGRNIRDCRKKKYPGRGGAKQCALDLGVTPQQWSPWERGGRMPDESRLEQIAEFFGVTVEWLRKDHRKIEPMFEPDSEHQKRSLPPIEGIDIPPSPSWHPDSPGSAESFFWLFRHFIAVIQTQGIRLDKQSLDYLAAQLKKPST